MIRSLISHIPIIHARLVGLTLGLALALPGAGVARGEPVTVTDVRLGQPGDRWLDQQRYTRLERVTLDGQFGYAVTYDIANHGAVRIFWPRAAIDFAGNSPRVRLLVTKMRRGRLWYPKIITAKSLPAVHRGILKLDAMYAADARGEKAVYEAFSLVVALASARPPVAPLPARPMSVQSSGRISSGSSKPPSPKPAGTTAKSNTGTTKAAAAITASAAKPAVASRRALARALEKAGHTRPPGAAAHHIVAGNAWRAESARKALRRVGIGINEASNGVFLPATRASANPTGAAVHSTLHTKAYYQQVNSLLSLVETKAQAVRALADIRHMLLNGGF